MKIHLCLLGLSQLMNAFQLAIINDMHLDPTFNTTSNYETVNLCKKLTLGFCHTDLGVYGAETPAQLVQTMVDKASPFSDSVLVNGDFVRHGIALRDPSGNWRTAFEKQKPIFRQNIGMIRSRFANVFPVIGNNDVAIHDQMPCSDDVAAQYFSELYDIWFAEGSQPHGFDDSAAKSTFLAGGYYRHDFPGQKVSLLALNTMYFMSENKCQLSRGFD